MKDNFYWIIEICELMIVQRHRDSTFIEIIVVNLFLTNPPAKHIKIIEKSFEKRS